MRQGLDDQAIWADKAPRPGPGFETAFIQYLQSIVAELPSGVAQLRIGRVPGHPDWPEPYFEVVPAKSNAARFAGVVEATALDLTFAGASPGFLGFAPGGPIFSWANCQ